MFTTIKIQLTPYQINTVRLTPFGSTYNYHALWPSFKIFPCAAIFHRIRNKHWTEFSFKVSWKLQDMQIELNKPQLTHEDRLISTATQYDGIFLSVVCGACICFSNFLNWRNKALKFSLILIFCLVEFLSAWCYYWDGLVYWGASLYLSPGRGEGGMFFFFWGGGGGSTLLEESSPTKYKGGAIQNWLQINRQWRGRGRGRGGHKWDHKNITEINQNISTPSPLLPLVDK